LWRWIIRLLPERFNKQSAKLTPEIYDLENGSDRLVKGHNIDVEALRLNSKMDQALRYRSSSNEKSDRAMISR
jgi:hypothetical protein